MSDNTTVPWRVGRSFAIHVYASDVPVATFHTATDAHAAVKAHNQQAELKAEVEHLTGILQAVMDVEERHSATIARVKALHTSKDNGLDVAWCANDMHGWPCPTIRALDAPTEPAPDSAPEPDAPARVAGPTPEAFGEGLGQGWPTLPEEPGTEATP